MPPAQFLPPSLALVDDDSPFSTQLCDALQARGIEPRWFASAESLLSLAAAHVQDFYVIDLQLPGMHGLALLGQLRERTDAGVLVVTGQTGPEVFEQVLGAGADMLLAKPASAAQVLMAVGAVYRRVAPAQAAGRAWRLDRGRRQLIAPSGAMVDLSRNDSTVLECLLDAQGQTVAPQALAQRLGWDGLDDPNLLHATIYRLRRRIGQATDGVAPLQAKSRQGYLFRAPLTAL